MNFIHVFLLISCVILYTAGIKDIDPEIRKCVNCLCHARTGCYSRFNCARYSINFDYWKKAKSPVVGVDDKPDEMSSYLKCMKNEDCIVNTIIQYVQSFGNMDCNCDGKFDCKDMFAMHLYGNDCGSPDFTQYYRRFNQCSASLGIDVMLSKEGSEGCVPSAV